MPVNDEVIRKEIEEVEQKIEQAEEILKNPDNQELFVLAKEEIEKLKEKERTLKRQLENLVKKPAAFSSVIMEIRAGTGGEEAALFAADLFRMYSRYAQSREWRQKILDSRPTELGGYKEIIFEINDSDVWSKMRYEGGVHRVQRIPKTEKGGRIHTSTASVAVLAKPQKAQVKISPDDLKTDFYGASGPGGQYLQKRHTAVRITHLPTGIVVTSQTERNQLENKKNALTILEARLLEKKQREEAEKLGGARRTQIGGAMRAEKIRTYNFPQDRIIDHRIGKKWHNIEEIMNGNLEPIIERLQKTDI